MLELEPVLGVLELVLGVLVLGVLVLGVLVLGVLVTRDASIFPTPGSSLLHPAH